MTSEKNKSAAAKQVPHAHSEQAMAGVRTAIDNLLNVETMLKNHNPCGEVVNRLTGILLALAECRSIIAADHLSSCGPLTDTQTKALLEVTTLFQLRLNKASIGSHH